MFCHVNSDSLVFFWYVWESFVVGVLCVRAWIDAVDWGGGRDSPSALLKGGMKDPRAYCFWMFFFIAIELKGVIGFTAQLLWMLCSWYNVKFALCGNNNSVKVKITCVAVKNTSLPVKHVEMHIYSSVIYKLMFGERLKKLKQNLWTCTVQRKANLVKQNVKIWLSCFLGYVKNFAVFL